MPLYEYECSKCGKRFEKIEKVTAPHVRKCPVCGGKAERLLASPAIQFKGSGWYVTDYGRKSSKAETKATSDTKEDRKPGKEAKEAATQAPKAPTENG